MPVVHDTIVDPAGRPVRNGKVTVRLIAAANGHDGPLYDDDDERTIIGTWTYKTDSEGAWSAALEPTEEFLPANAYYAYLPTPNAEVVAFAVPEAAGPHWVGDLLLDPPPALGPFLSELLADEIARATAAEAAETAARIAADAAEATTRATADTTEATARAAADTAEANARAAADTTLTTNLAAEVTARTADVDAEETRALAAEAAEASARATAISTEASTRSTADSTLTTNLSDEATTRANADTALANDIAGIETDLGNLDTDLASEITRATAAEALRALDTAVVHNTGAETVDGVKTFSSAPVVPSGAFPQAAITSLVADLAALVTSIAAKAADSAVVHNTGAETVAGIKTFSSAPVVPDATFAQVKVVNLVADLATLTSAVALRALDSAVAHLAGAETFTGAKKHEQPVTALVSGLSYGLSMAAAPHVFEVGVYVDNMGRIALNLDGDGNRIDATRASVAIQFEDLFRQGPGNPYISELNFDFITPSGDSVRTMGFSVEHVTGLSHAVILGRLTIQDTAGTTPYFVFESDTGGAFRITSGGFFEISAEPGAAADALFIGQRLDNPASAYSFMEDLQILRVRADGNVGINTWSQFGSGLGVLGLRDAGIVPTTNPTLGCVVYAEAGVFKVRGSDGQIDSLRTAQPAAFLFRSPAMYGADAGAAAIGANTIDYVPFWVEKQNAKVDRIVFEVTAAAGNVDGGIFASDGSSGAPGTRIVSSGSVACPAGPEAKVDLAETTLPPGKYYAALASNNAGAQFRYVGGLNKVRGMGPVHYVGSGFPLPSVESAPSPDTTTGNAFAVYAAHT